jgi:hypothetical protein
MGRPSLTLWVGIGLAAAGVAALLLGSACFSPPQRGTPAVAPWDDGLVRFPGDDGPRREHRHLTGQIQVVLQRVEDKQAAADALARGEITFAQAVDRFRAIAADDPNALAWLRAKYPGATEDELHYRNVLGFVRPALEIGPLKNADRLARLEEEFRRRFPGRSPKVLPLPGG